jgi:hypothetical protein
MLFRGWKTDWNDSWAAGLLDGDGTIVHNTGGYVSVHLGSTDFEIVALFKDAVGSGHISGPYRHRHQDRWSKKPQYYFQAYAQGTDILESLWFALSKAKRSQAARSASKLRAASPHRSIPEFLLDFANSDSFCEMSPRLKLAWAAGFFDAEGCTSFSPRSGVCVSITQTDKEVLERFSAAVGVGRIYGPYTSKHDDGLLRRPHYFYRATGHQNVQAVVAMIWPWLGSEKRRQATVRLTRCLLCKRGHPKVVGHKGCSTCRVEQWREWRIRRGVPPVTDSRPPSAKHTRAPRTLPKSC